MQRAVKKRFPWRIQSIYNSTNNYKFCTVSIITAKKWVILNEHLIKMWCIIWISSNYPNRLYSSMPKRNNQPVIDSRVNSSKTQLKLSLFLFRHNCTYCVLFKRCRRIILPNNFIELSHWIRFRNEYGCIGSRFVRESIKWKWKFVATWAMRAKCACIDWRAKWYIGIVCRALEISEMRETVCVVLVFFDESALHFKEHVKCTIDG